VLFQEFTNPLLNAGRSISKTECNFAWRNWEPYDVGEHLPATYSRSRGER